MFIETNLPIIDSTIIHRRNYAFSHSRLDSKEVICEPKKNTTRNEWFSTMIYEAEKIKMKYDCLQRSLSSQAFSHLFGYVMHCISVRKRKFKSFMSFLLWASAVAKRKLQCTHSFLCGFEIERKFKKKLEIWNSFIKSEELCPSMVICRLWNRPRNIIDKHVNGFEFVTSLIETPLLDQVIAWNQANLTLILKHLQCWTNKFSDEMINEIRNQPSHSHSMISLPILHKVH